MNEYVLYYFPAFTNAGHGGGKRTAQITDSLMRCGKLNSLERALTLGEKVRAGLRLPGLMWRLRRYDLSQSGLRAIGRWAQLIYEANLSQPSAKYFIESNHGTGLIVALACAVLNIDFTLLPHNIEFLVPSQHKLPFFKSALGERQAEILILQRATRVVTISEFDRAVVASLGGSAECVYYWPPVAESNDLARIRAAREGRSDMRSRRILCIGTMNNAPTRLSFSNGIRSVASSLGSEWQIVVAGFGTEQLPATDSNVTILGEVTDAELDIILRDVDVAVIPVRQSSGLLTRLSILNCAGVPVVCIGRHLGIELLQGDGISIRENTSDLASVIRSAAIVAPICEQLRSGSHMTPAFWNIAV